MTRFCSIALLFICPLALAQGHFGDSFGDFRKKSKDSMKEFRKDKNLEFADALAKQWAEFKCFEAKVCPVKPKPHIVPIAPATEEPADARLPIARLDKLPELKARPLTVNFKSANLVVKAPSTMKEDSFDFYGITIKCPPRALRSRSSLLVSEGETEVSEKSVSDFWKHLETDRGADGLTLTEELSVYFNRLNLKEDWSDWTVVRMIQMLSEHWWQEPSEQVIVQVFLLNKLGLDARIGRTDKGNLCLIFPTEQEVFGRQYIVLSGQNYYILDTVKVNNVHTYNIEQPAGQPNLRTFDMVLDKPDRTFSKEDATLIEKSLPTLGKTISVPIRNSRKDFYLDYPQVGSACYLNENLDPELASAIASQLDTLGRMDKLAAVNLLLSCLQHDFDYATDSEQFGYEKPFFVAENFIYPKNDCEDRAVLFVYLVQKVIGLDAVLVDYPDHVAAAVRLPQNITGAYYEHKGARFYVCDPTYIGARAGMIMPRYSEVPAKLLM